jgi:hypothetical protein
MLAWAIVLWTLVVIMFSALAYGATVGARDLRLERITVHLPKLAPDLAGLRVLHLSDTHFMPGTFIRPLYEKMVAAAGEAGAELILLTGDLAAGSANMPVALEWLSRLSAPLGVFTVLGNHDLDVTMERWLLDLETGGDPEDLREGLAEAGVTLLHNEWRVVEARGRRVLLVGIGDASCGLDDLPAVIAGAPEADLVIYLSHSPDVFDRAGMEHADLVLCGHTHAGQMMLPGIGPLWAPVWRGRRRGVGVLALGEVVGHVTRGVGATWPARIGAPPQAALLELQPGQPDGLAVKPALARKPLPAATETIAEGDEAK